MISLHAAAASRNNPLIRELQQGRKMRSLDTLMDKLDQDQHRHIEHGSMVEQGLTLVHAAQAGPTLVVAAGQNSGLAPGQPSPLAASPTSPMSSPERLRNEVAASRIDNGSTEERRAASSEARVDKEVGAISLPPGPPGTASPTRRHRMLRKAESNTDENSEGAGCGLAEQQEPALLPHSGKVTALAVASGGKLVAAGCDDKAFVLWDVATETRRWEVSVGAPISAVACSHSGAYAACGSLDNSVVTWHVGTKTTLWTRTMDSLVTALTFHAQSDALAIGEGSGKVTILSTTSQILLTVEHCFAARSLSFSPDGTLLAIGGEDCQDQDLSSQPEQPRTGYPRPNSSPSGRSLRGFTLYEVGLAPGADATSKEVALEPFDTSVSVVAFSPSGNWLAVGVFKGRPRIALLARSEEFKELAELYCSAGVTCISWLPSSQAIFCAGEDKVLSFWCISSTSSQQLVPQQPAVAGRYRGLACCGRTQCIATFADGDTFVRLNRLEVTDESSLVAPGTGRDTQRNILTDQRVVAQALQQEASRTKTPQPAPRRHAPAAPKGGGLAMPVNMSMELSKGTIKMVAKKEEPKDGPSPSPVRRTSIIGIAEEGATPIEVHDCPTDTSSSRCHDLSTLLEVDKLCKEITIPSDRESLGLLHEGDVIAVAFSPDGSTLIAAGLDCLVAMWDIVKGDRLMEAKMDSSVPVVAFSSDGQYAAAAEECGAVHVWSGDTAKKAGSAELDGEPLSLALCVAPRVMAVGLSSKKVCLFDLPGLHRVAEFFHEGPVHGLAFSPDGRFLCGGGCADASSSLAQNNSGTAAAAKALVWKVSKEGDKCRNAATIAFSGSVHVVAFSPNGAVLACGGEIASISMFSVENDFDRATALSTAAPVRCLAFSKDACFLASGGDDMQVTVWNLIKGQVAFKLPKVSDWCCGVSFNPQTSWLACCSYGSSQVLLHPLAVTVTQEAAAPELGMAPVISLPSSGPTRAPSVPSPVAPQAAIMAAKTSPSPKAKAGGGLGGGLAMPKDMMQAMSAGTVKFHAPSSVDSLPTSMLDGAKTASKSARLQNDAVTFNVGLAGKDLERDRACVDLAGGFAYKVTLNGRASENKLLEEHIRKPKRASVTEGMSGFDALFNRIAIDKLRPDKIFKHDEEVMDLAFSPCGCFVVAGGEDTCCVMWDIANNCQKMASKMNGPVKAVAYSPTGKYIAAGDEESFIYVWYAETCEEVGMQAVDGQVLSLAINSSPELLAAGTKSKTVELLSLPGLDSIASLRHDGDVHSLSFSGDGGLLAGGGGTDNMHGLMTKKANAEQDGMKTVVWNISDKSDGCGLLGSLVFQDVVRAVAFCPAGKMLAVGSEGRSIAMLVVGKQFEKATELPCEAGIRTLSWSADSRFLASAGEAMQISVWDLVTEQVIFHLPKVDDWYCCIAFCPKTKWIGAVGYGCRDVTLHPIKATNGMDQIEQAPEPVEIESDDEGGVAQAVPPVISTPVVEPLVGGIVPAPSVSPPPGKGSGKSKGKGLATPTNFQLAAGTVKFNAPLPTTTAEPTSGASASSASSTAAAPGLGVPANGRRPSKRIDLHDDGFNITVTKAAQKARPKLQKSRTLTTLTHQDMESKDVKTLVCPDKERSVQLLKHTDEMAGLAFSADGKSLIAGGEDCQVVIWDLTSMTKKMDVKISSPVKQVAYAPDGRFVAATDESSCVYIWDAATFEEVETSHVNGSILSLALCSNPDLVALGTSEKQVTLMSVPDLHEIAELQHEGDVHTVTFSADGGLLAGGGGTDEHHGLMTKKNASNGMKTVVWTVNQCGEHCRYLGMIEFDNVVHSCAFSPSGKVLAVGGESNEISMLMVKDTFQTQSKLISTHGVRTLSWSKDSCFLCSGGEDLQVTVWNLLTDSVLFKLPKVEDWYCGIAFSPSMEWIATCGFGNNNVTLHPITTKPAMATNEGEGSKTDGPSSPTESPSASNDADPAVHAAPTITPAFSIGVSSSPVQSAPTASAKGPGAPGGLGAPGRQSLALASPRDKKAMLSAGTIKFGSPQKGRESLPEPVVRSAVRRPSRILDDQSGFAVKVKDARGQDIIPGHNAMAKHIDRQSVVRTMHGEAVSHDFLRLNPDEKSIHLEYTDDVLALALSPDGESVVAGSEDCTVVLWDIEHKHKVMEGKMQGPVKAVACSPDGRYIAAGDDTGCIGVYKVEADQCEEVGTTHVEGSVLSIALSSRPNMMAIGTDKKQVHLFTIPALEEIAELTHGGDVNALSFTLDAKFLAGGGGTDDMHGLMTKKLNSEGHNMKVMIWQVSEIGDECKVCGNILHDDVVQAVAYSPSQKLLAVGDESRKVSILIPGEDYKLGGVLQCPAGVRCLAWSADSRFLATGGEDMQISVWDLLKEIVLFQLPKAQDWFNCVAFSPTNNWLATCGFGDKSITLYPIEGGVEEEKKDEEEIQSNEGDEDSDEDEKGDEDAVANGAPLNVVIPSISLPGAPLNVMIPTISLPK